MVSLSNVKVTPIVKAAMHSLFYDHNKTKGWICKSIGIHRNTGRPYFNGRRIENMNDEIRGLVEDILKGRFTKRVQRRGKKWVVTDSSGKKVLGTHDSREEAMNQLRAVEANKKQKGVNLLLNPVEMPSKKNTESSYQKDPTYRDEEMRLARNVLKGINIRVDPIEMPSKKNTEDKFSSTPKPRDEEERIGLHKSKNISEFVKSIFGKKCDRDKKPEKATDSYSRSESTHDPNYEDEDKKKKVKKTYCERFEELLTSLDGKETDKTVTIKKEFIRNFDLALVPRVNDNQIRKARFLMKGEVEVLSRPIMKADGTESGDLIIGGYASTDSIDVDNEVIDQDALKKAFIEYMRDQQFANINLMHGSFQAGVPLMEVEIGSKIHKTRFDENGLYLISKIRNDNTEECQRVRKQIMNGELRGYSIGGEALDTRPVCEPGSGCFDKITKLDLWEITLCQKGKNPDSQFDVLKAPAA